jgi:hypothetical protein
MTVELATPAAALVALAGLVPVAVSLTRSRRARDLLRVLGLPEPRAAARVGRPAALGCAFALLGLAAAQPSLVRQRERLVRADTQMLVVLDTSRSMLASLRSDTAPRYQRATAFARRLHAALPELAAGVASLNNRLLPYLFPTVDEQAYASVVNQAYGIQKPPPAVDPDPLATSFDELSQVTTQRFFSSGAHTRLLLVLSDAETRPFDAVGTLAALRRTRTTPIVVRFWQPGERIFRAGRARGSYHSTQPNELDVLRAAGWAAYSEREPAAVVHRIKQTIGSGPLAQAGYRRRETSIAPEIALAALAPLLLVVAPAGLFPGRRRARPRSLSVRS